MSTTLICFAPPPLIYGAFTLYGAAFQPTSNLETDAPPTSTVRCRTAFGLRFSAFSHPYLPNPYWFLFLPVLECFNSRGSLCLSAHSPISGSKDACSYPELFAACHGAVKLPKPSHPLIGVTCISGKLQLPLFILMKYMQSLHVSCLLLRLRFPKEGKTCHKGMTITVRLCAVSLPLTAKRSGGGLFIFYASQPKHPGANVRACAQNNCGFLLVRMDLKILPQEFLLACGSFSKSSSF